MDSKRLDLLASDLYYHVFHTLDAEPDLTGDEAGRVARAAEVAFRLAMADEPDDSFLLDPAV